VGFYVHIRQSAASRLVGLDAALGTKPKFDTIVTQFVHIDPCVLPGHLLGVNCPSNMS